MSPFDADPLMKPMAKRRGPATVVVLDARRRYGMLAEARADRSVRFRRWLRRHARLLALAGGTVLALLLLAVLVAAAMLTREAS